MPASDTFVIVGGGLVGSGTPEELMEAAGSSASGIAAAARELKD